MLNSGGVISCSVKYLYFGRGKAEGRRQEAEGFLKSVTLILYTLRCYRT
ncbi:MAG: hypothetical protein F6K17_17875 [Okeania sp. SIO3C4]|nr:hypothetical protein [Okeania sp. SIO3B3]NER04344.1 hypothetical protein [Okeania sp. SIO3C4]